MSEAEVAAAGAEAAKRLTRLVAENMHIGEALHRDNTRLQGMTAEQTSMYALESNEARVKERWARFEENHRAIMQVPGFQQTDYHIKGWFVEAEAVYISVLERIGRLHVEARRLEEIPANPATPAPQSGAMKLPNIDLPVFSGNILEWESFRDQFASLIHDSKVFTKVQKLLHLQRHLTGEAAEVIKNTPPTDRHYEPAWNALVTRYGNQRILSCVHMKSLVDLPPARDASPTEIKRVMDFVQQTVRSFTTLGKPIQEWNEWFVFFLSSKLDPGIRVDWETSLKASAEVPEFQKLTDFLENRLQALQTITAVGPTAEPSQQTVPDTKPQPSLKPRQRTAAVAISRNPGLKCPICSQPHHVSRCTRYESLNLSGRQDLVRTKKLCANCLGAGHFRAKCPSSGRCRTCNGQHHTSLHQEDQPSRRLNSTHEGSVNLTTASEPHQTPESEQRTNADARTSNTRETASSALTVVSGTVLLATAVIRIVASDQGRIQVRALLDPGADTSFFSEAIVRRAGLTMRPAKVSVMGFSSAEPLQVRHQVTADIENSNGEFTMRITALVKPKMNFLLPSSRVQVQDWPHLQGLQLADPDFMAPDRIDVLLGADVWNQVFLDERRKGLAGTPDAYLTRFGYVILGHTGTNAVCSTVNTIQSREDAAISAQLRRFWEVEELPLQPVLSPEDELFEKYFQETHTRSPTGRYIVRLPFKRPVGHLLDNSKPRAVNLLRKLQQRFARDQIFEGKYREFLQEYEQLGHMHIVHKSRDQLPEQAYFIPHHGVFKNHDPDKKIRVVFNASARAPSGFSLNDLLISGPKLQEDLWIIFLRWRMHKFVYTADCVKFYHQIEVHPEDQHLQSIVFVDKLGNDQIFELSTVTYGTKPAQALALRAVAQLVSDEGHRFPRAEKVIKRNKYIDDYLFGASTIQELEHTRSELIRILQAGGMELAKWASNVHQHLDEGKVQVFRDSEGIKTLGVTWTPSTDTFAVTVQLNESTENITKRIVLSDTSSIFDVNGTKAPTTIKAKIYMQDLWLSGAAWDQKLEGELLEEWLQIRDELAELPDFQDERWLRTTPTGRLQVHGFADASSRAYAAAIYLRTEDEKGVSTALAICKTRVAPIKTLSIPKLELAGAHLLASMLDLLKRHLDLKNAEFFAWLDAEVVLAWIRSHASRWKPYVANRVAQIQTLTDIEIWNHVSSENNPADLATRGLSPKELQQSSLWHHGPAYLLQDPAAWPRSPISENPERANQELRSKAQVSTLVSAPPEWELFSRFPTLLRLVRVGAIIIIFVENCRQKSRRRRIANWRRAARNFQLTPAHLLAGLQWLIRICQNHHFPNECKALKNVKRIPSRSPLLILRPFISSDGCIRVGGRLQRANLPYNERHPYIIPRNSNLAKLLAENAHEVTMHGGTQLSLRHIASNFWILRGRSLVRSVVRGCVKCTRFRAQPMEQIMAQLPSYRTTPQRPFLTSGVDFAGPIMLRASAGRGHQSFKGYICVFVCMTTKAIHLEAAVDLSTSGFISAYRRFVSRRGKCSELHSDNGTNFRGASKELRTMFTEASKFYKKCCKFLADEGTKWVFNPPSAPHFGGIWEAGVKFTKHHLRRVIGASTLILSPLKNYQLFWLRLRHV